LRNRKYSFLPNKRFSLALIVISLFFLFSCEKSVIWGVKRQEFRSKIEKGDFSFLREINFSQVKLDDIMQLAPGAAYYVSHMLPDREQVVARRLLALEWRRGASPWKFQAGEELAAAYLSEKQYAKAYEITSTLLNENSTVFNNEQLKKLQISALYRQEQDEKLLDTLNRYYEQSMGNNLEENDPELLLFKAVASCRLDKDGWEGLFRELFYRIPANELHGRAYLYLLYNKDKLGNFSDQDLGVFKAKSLMSEGKYKEAYPIIKAAVTRTDPVNLGNNVLLEDFAFICLGARGSSTDAGLVVSLAKQAEHSVRLSALEYAAKVYARHRAYKAAVSVWSQIFRQADNEYLKKRARWYMLKNTIPLGRSAVLRELQASVPGWYDFDFYSDLLDDYIATLLWTRHYETVRALYLVFKQTPPNPLRARLTYLTARLESLGYLPGNDVDKEDLSHGLFTQDGYYALLASRFLNTKPPVFTWSDRPAGGGGKVSGQGRLIMDCFNYGLFDMGISLLRKNRELFTPAELFALAGRLYRRNQYLYCMRIVGLLKYIEKKPLYKEEVGFLYPLAFKQEIQDAAARVKLEPYLFFSLIRRESGFDTTIISHAGAVGLSQLMPATAADIARRIGLENPDLTNPRQNALMGAYFFTDLLRRFATVPRALAAYNAGPARVRRWARTIGRLPDDLYIEAIPITETRRFVRIVCTGAVYYSFLYDGKKSPAERVKEIFK